MRNIINLLSIYRTCPEGVKRERRDWTIYFPLESHLRNYFYVKFTIKISKILRKRNEDARESTKKISRIVNFEEN